ncbi:MAG: DUF1559 domain-containing protein [Planctomycetales bacterium]|nr:DUF1559 domain-containing protein [Planctomycetales bacterium]
MICKKNRLGFTLVELLVVIAIIGVLVGLLLPAVQAAREAARRMQCSNNLKQMGLAIHNHESSFKYMPAAEKDLPAATYPSPPNPYGSLATYGTLFHLLPFMEQMNIYNLVDTKRSYIDPVNMQPPYGTASPLAASPVSTFLCPSAPANAPSDYGPYFASVGLDLGPYVAPRTDYIPIKGLHRSLAVCAGKANTTTQNGLLGTSDPEKKPHIKFGEVSDGLSNTILFAELAGRQKLYFRGKPLPGNSLADGGLTLNSYYGDSNTAREMRGYSGADILNPTQAGCSAINVMNLNGPYAFHPGGVLIAMGDGSVHFLSDSVSTIVFAGLVTRDGGESVSLEQ